MTIRAFYRATQVTAFDPPYNTVTMKVYYPAKDTLTEQEQHTGAVAANPDHAPYPVLIILPGINVGPEAYAWLATHLAEQGIVTITYTLLSNEMPGLISQSPGISIEALRPEQFGQSSCAAALPAILDEINAIQHESLLAGLLDTDNIVLLGHSAGGTVSLLSGNPQWYPSIKGVISYAAHTLGSVAIGWEDDTPMPTPSAVPTLIIGGARDGVIAASASSYGEKNATPFSSLIKTFEQAISSNRNDSYLAIIDGANHFAITHPQDITTSRPFADLEQTQSPEAIRTLLASLIAAFIDQHVVQLHQKQQSLDDLFSPTLINLSQKK